MEIQRRTQVGLPHEPRDARCPQLLPGGQECVGATGHLAPRSPKALFSGRFEKNVSSPALVHHFSPRDSRNLGPGRQSSNLYPIHMGRTLTSGKNLGPQNRFILSHSVSHSVVSDSLTPTRLLSPWDSPDKNTGGGGRSLLQGIFPTQGSNPGLLHCRQILYRLSHQGSPPFSGINTAVPQRVQSKLITLKGAKVRNPSTERGLQDVGLQHLTHALHIPSTFIRPLLAFLQREEPPPTPYTTAGFPW